MDFLVDRRRAFSHKYTLKNFCFFPVRDILDFHLIKSKLLGTYWSDSPNFCINTLTGYGFTIYHVPNFSLARIFFAELLALKMSFFAFFKVQNLPF